MLRGNMDGISKIRVILSVKRTNSESKGKRLEVGWEAGGLPLKIFPRIPAALSFSWAGEEWLAVRQKHQNRKKLMEENFNPMFGLF